MKRAWFIAIIVALLILSSCARPPVDEALPKLDKYLDDAFLDGLNQVRIVHGKGTGTLRRAITEHLAQHSLVASYRGGEYGEGGIGVTIVGLVPKASQ